MHTSRTHLARLGIFTQVEFCDLSLKSSIRFGSAESKRNRSNFLFLLLPIIHIIWNKRSIQLKEFIDIFSLKPGNITVYLLNSLFKLKKEWRYVILFSIFWDTCEYNFKNKYINETKRYGCLKFSAIIDSIIRK